jgi:hypothetical protein
MKKQIKYCFQIDPEDEKRIKALPRAIKISEKLRFALKQILTESEQSS